MGVCLWVWLLFFRPSGVPSGASHAFDFGKDSIPEPPAEVEPAKPAAHAPAEAEGHGAAKKPPEKKTSNKPPPRKPPKKSGHEASGGH